MRSCQAGSCRGECHQHQPTVDCLYRKPIIFTLCRQIQHPGDGLVLHIIIRLKNIEIVAAKRQKYLCDLVLRGDGEHAGHQQQAGGEEAARHADDRPLGLLPPDGLSPLPLPLRHSPGICTGIRGIQPRINRIGRESVTLIFSYNYV